MSKVALKGREWFLMTFIKCCKAWFLHCAYIYGVTWQLLIGENILCLLSQPTYIYHGFVI